MVRTTGFTHILCIFDVSFKESEALSGSILQIDIKQLNYALQFFSRGQVFLRINQVFKRRLHYKNWSLPKALVKLLNAVRLISPTSF